MSTLFENIIIMLVLLNPFLVIVYLIDVVKKLPFKKFCVIIIQAGLFSLVVFILFALMGDIIFRQILHAEFASFQIFGGIVFLIIGIQFVFRGEAAIESLRGESEYIRGAIAMPILIGPGTLSASVVTGKYLTQMQAILSISISVFISLSVLILLKVVHDKVQVKKSHLIDRYTEIMGRITALIVGTISIDMIMRGLKAWITTLQF
ncbi:MAG: MarC family protein [bacterium]